MSKPRNPNDTILLSDAIRVNFILPHEPLPALFITVSSLMEDMNDDMTRVLDSGTVQAHFSLERMVNGEWKQLVEKDFTEKNRDEVTELLEEVTREEHRSWGGMANKRFTLQYVHVPIVAGRKTFAAVSGMK